MPRRDACRDCVWWRLDLAMGNQMLQNNDLAPCFALPPAGTEFDGRSGKVTVMRPFLPAGESVCAHFRVLLPGTPRPKALGVCRHCRWAHPPEGAMRAKVRFPPDFVFCFALPPAGTEIDGNTGEATVMRACFPDGEEACGMFAPLLLAPEQDRTADRPETTGNVVKLTA